MSGLNFGYISQNLILNATEFDLVKQKKSLELKTKLSKTVCSAYQRKCLLSCHEYIELKLLTSQSSGQGNN